MITSREDATRQDHNDPLRHLRDRFHLPDGVIYLDGNSLGPMPAAAPERLGKVIAEEWGESLIRSWNDAGWFTLTHTLGDRLGAVLGAAAGQTLVCDSTSVNLYKAVRAALGLRPDRSVIVTEADSFPTDLYIIEGAMAGGGQATERRLLGLDGGAVDDLLDEHVAVLILSHVNYRTGRLMDMAGLTRKAHEVGALVIWDLCHSAGIVPTDLDGANVDFAVGCTYKYLNGGPGAPAFIYVARRHHDAAVQPLSGWWGHARPFDFEMGYEPAGGIARFLCGTQPILSMSAVEIALDALDGVQIEALRTKSQALTQVFIDLVTPLQQPFGLEIVTPANPQERGSQVAIRFEHGYPVVQAMIGRGVIGDFRAPDMMRFGFAPAYLRFTDVWDSVEVLRGCLEEEVWRDSSLSRRAAVT